MASEELSSNVERWFQFLGLGEGDVLELQALGIPTRYAPQNQFTHVATVDDAVVALMVADQQAPIGTYCIFNEVDPAVATRAAIGRWHVARRGESTTDRDILARRALFIDVDAERASGTSASDAELGRAVAKAAEILCWLGEKVPEGAIGMGHSGNGVSLFVALDAIAETPELARFAKALLAGLDHRFSCAGVKIDRTVGDAKRLCPAFGTTKRKGAPDIEDRPHRKTGFWCAPSIERLDLAAVEALVATLRAELDHEGQHLVDRELGVAKASSRGLGRSPGISDKWALPPGPYQRANAVPIADVVAWLGLDAGDGRVRCPGCGESDHGVALVGNGLKCHHARCADKGVTPGFRSVVDLVAEARGVPPPAAVNLHAEQFGFRGLAERGEHVWDAPQQGAASSTSGDAAVINLSSLEKYEVNDLVAEAIGGLDDLYQRLGRVVRVQESLSRAPGESTPHTRLEIRAVSEALLRDRITRACTFWRCVLNRHTDEYELVRSPPPTWCVSAVAQRGQWPTLRHLQLVTDVPLLLGDGGVLEEPGYDEATASLYRPAFAMPSLVHQPSREAATASAAALLTHVADFPFERPDHRAAWLAALLTPIARWAYRGQSPLFLMDANQAGSGKGLLLKVIGWLVQGREMDVILQTEDEDEERKRITAKLLSGARMVQIDNIIKPFGSAPLDALLTTGVWAERLLGTNDAPALDSCVVWYGSGNNVGFRRDDTRRRTCIVRLLTEQERPEERTGFAIADLESYVQEHRAELYGAALTLRGSPSTRSMAGAGPGAASTTGTAWSVERWSTPVSSTPSVPRRHPRRPRRALGASSSWSMGSRRRSATSSSPRRPRAGSASTWRRAMTGAAWCAAGGPRVAWPPASAPCRPSWWTECRLRTSWAAYSRASRIDRFASARL